MDKKYVKTIEIVCMKVNTLGGSSDKTGEYTTYCDVDFILTKSTSFSIFDKEYYIDRIKMSSTWDNIILEYANESQTFSCLDVSKVFVHKIYNKVIEEQKEGILKGWSFIFREKIRGFIVGKI